MAEATLRTDTGGMEVIDYTPTGGNVSRGQVVLLGNTAGVACGIAVMDITNNTLGSVYVGGGVFRVTMLPNVANYARVYWDDTNNKVTSTSTNMAPFGWIVSGGGGGANASVDCLFDPKIPAS